MGCILLELPPPELPPADCQLPEAALRPPVYEDAAYEELYSCRDTPTKCAHTPAQITNADMRQGQFCTFAGD